jgi:aryl-alcohol dehydrogenase-like predicted oxidoreductase
MSGAVSDVEYRQLGHTGLYISALGLGCNNFGSRIDADQASAVANQAFEDGVTLFDTAEAYGNGVSEEYLGAALGRRRSEVVIATKFGSPLRPGPGAPGSRHNVMRACAASLRRLGTDYIDLYYLHMPDPKTPIEETLDAMSDLVHQGKVRYIAASNLASWQVSDADHTARQFRYERFAANQIEWNLLARGVERELVPACRYFGVGVVAYQALASGMLTGKYIRGEPFPAGSRMALGCPISTAWSLVRTSN